MPDLSGTIDRLGAMADVRVMLSHQRVDALKRAGRSYAPPQTVLGLIDTGASCSAIDATLAQAMGLEPRGVTQIHTPSTGDASSGATSTTSASCLATISREPST